MKVAFADDVDAHSETFSAGLYTRQRSLSRFLHHITELAGQHYPTASLSKCRLNLQDLAADLRPGQAGGQANLARGGHALLAKLDWTKHLADTFGVNCILEVFVYVF